MRFIGDLPEDIDLGDDFFKDDLEEDFPSSIDVAGYCDSMGLTKPTPKEPYTGPMSVPFQPKQTMEGKDYRNKEQRRAENRVREGNIRLIRRTEDVTPENLNVPHVIIAVDDPLSASFSRARKATQRLDANHLVYSGDMDGVFYVECMTRGHVAKHYTRETGTRGNRVTETGGKVA